MTNSNPSFDPANNDSLAGTFNALFKQLLMNTDGMLPAKIISYDRETNRARVQILIAMITTDNTRVSRPVVASVPVLVCGGGGFMINFPLKENDLGWILANDRDISIFLQNYQESTPNTYLVKNFANGIFIPDIMTNYEIDLDDTDNLVIQNRTGTTKITLNETDINIESSLELNIKSTSVNIDATNADISASNVSVSATSLSIDMGLPVNKLTINGGISATGNVSWLIPPYVGGP